MKKLCGFKKKIKNKKVNIGLRKHINMKKKKK